ncbi:LytR C-terminal domain-containing protein [Cellulomonas shaoxiangyii]|uniref:LytR family transcriptional regulator n=1 Tax=Cellulomonas shaoxiangyii TaxID=2566013 RepID=A0A4V1CMY6_9CELL|nr:LytR C-terminal domain-containing protein [Cellulomonas shaoxiangyii]QCB94575.1 LytR family transcriptional regulator [Cellulomonas shaoxiangyii]TGY85019.1 LytR family transcriptional regulator [Cellulomonas shaoxiangyii]
MSKADYPYPDDEFDAATPDGPRGVHRAPRSAWSRWWPFLVVLLVVPVLAYGAVAYLSRTGDLPVVGGGTAPAAEETQAPEDPAAGEPAPEGEGPTETAPEPEAPVAEPVLTTPVEVLNGARVAGLAGRVADDLLAAGFTDVAPDNATEDLPDVSTVYVASEDLRTTADLVASTTGVPAVEVDPDRALVGIVVVLVTDPAA